jgi:peptidoglycan/LPS O-acetylase OafA/YrhL
MSRTAAREASYPLFDWLRFALASVVVLVHGGIAVWPDAGNFAVCVFFALSGWLIGGILLNTPMSALPRFYFNRSFRIWIPYAVAVAALYATAALHEGADGRFFQFLFYDLTFTHYWFIPKTPQIIQLMPLDGTGAHFWSISVEEQFYLFAPLILIFLPWGRTVFLWAILCLAALLVDYHYACITLGVLAALLKDKFGVWYGSTPVQAILVSALLALFAVIVRDHALYVWFAPLAALLVVMLCARQGSRQPVAQFLGGISYPLYLNHWMGIFAANFLSKALTLSSAMHIAAAYVLALIAGALAYIFVDRWVLARRSTLYTDHRGRVLMAVAYALLLMGVVTQLVWLDPLGKYAR